MARRCLRDPIAYRYVWNGQTYTGRTYQKDGNKSYELTKAERPVRAYPVGVRRTCYVNPRRLAEAILKHDNVWLPSIIALSRPRLRFFRRFSPTGAWSW